MDDSNPTPRVGFPQLKNMIGRKVLFVGRIESMDQGRVHMVAPDGSKVIIQSNGVFDSQFVEVEGTVVDPMTIQEASHTNFSENFDMNMYNDLLKLINDKYTGLFYPPFA